MPSLVSRASGLIEAAVVCFTLGSTPVAKAQSTRPASPGIHLSWVRSNDAADCVDASRIAADVVKRLGWSPFDSPLGPQASIETLVTRNALKWRAEIVMRRTDGSLLGSREVQSEAPSCDSLARASGLAIALMIETAYPDLGAGELRSATDDERTIAEFAAPLSAHDPTSQVADRASSGDSARPSFSLTGGILCTTGVLPGLACGPTLRTELEVHAPFTAAVAVAVVPERSIVRGNSNVAFGLSYASLGGCYHLGLNDSWSLAPCGALLVGASHVAVGAQTPVTAGQRLWSAAAAGVHSSFQYGALELQAGADVVIPLDRRDYVVDDAEVGRFSLFEEPAVGTATTIAAGVHF